MRLFSSDRLSVWEQNEPTSSLDTRNCLLPNSLGELCHQTDIRQACFRKAILQNNKSLSCPMCEENKCTKRLKCPITSVKSSVRFGMETYWKLCPYSTPHSPKLLVLWVPVFPLQKMTALDVCILINFSHIWLFVTLWTIAHQAPLSMGFSRQES